MVSEAAAPLAFSSASRGSVSSGVVPAGGTQTVDVTFESASDPGVQGVAIAGFRIWEVGVDGTGLRQVSQAPQDEAEKAAREARCRESQCPYRLHRQNPLFTLA